MQPEYVEGVRTDSRWTCSFDFATNSLTSTPETHVARVYECGSLTLSSRLRFRRWPARFESGIPTCVFGTLHLQVALGFRRFGYGESVVEVARAPKIRSGTGTERLARRLQVVGI